MEKLPEDVRKDILRIPYGHRLSSYGTNLDDERVEAILDPGEYVLFPCALSRENKTPIHPVPGVLCIYRPYHGNPDTIFFSNESCFDGGTKHNCISDSGIPYPCGMKRGWHVCPVTPEELFLAGDAAHAYVKFMESAIPLADGAKSETVPDDYGEFVHDYAGSFTKKFKDKIGFCPFGSGLPFYVPVKDGKFGTEKIENAKLPILDFSAPAVSCSGIPSGRFDSAPAQAIPDISDLVEKAKAKAFEQAGLPKPVAQVSQIPLQYSRRNASTEAMAYAISEFGKIKERVDAVSALPAPDGGPENAKKEWDALKAAALQTVSSLSESFSDDPQAKSVCDVVLKWMEIQEEPESAKGNGQPQPGDGTTDGQPDTGEEPGQDGERPAPSDGAGKERSGKPDGQAASSAKGPFGKRPGCYPDDVVSGFKDAAIAAGYRIKGESVGDLRLIWGKLSGAYPTGFYLVPGAGAVSAGQYERALLAQSPKA